MLRLQDIEHVAGFTHILCMDREDASKTSRCRCAHPVIIVSTPLSTSPCAPIHNSACLTKVEPTGISLDFASLILAS